MSARHLIANGWDILCITQIYVYLTLYSNMSTLRNESFYQTKYIICINLEPVLWLLNWTRIIHHTYTIRFRNSQLSLRLDMTNSILDFHLELTIFLSWGSVWYYSVYSVRKPKVFYRIRSTTELLTYDVTYQNQSKVFERNVISKTNLNR